MHQRTGSANLPLHGGHVPAWLSVRMAALGRVIAGAIVHEHGRDELLRRLAQSFWFQSFGAVMGMDWHSLRDHERASVGAPEARSGSDPTGIGAFTCAAVEARIRGAPPQELLRIRWNDGRRCRAAVRASRLVAKDRQRRGARRNLLSICMRSFATVDGHWCIVQQGMNERSP